jgi:spore coat polysaccharide biosynthesis protein SpsF (cytidylyltransferase family)
VSHLLGDILKFLAIIQARCGSTRLPDKILMDLEGKTVLERVVERVKLCESVSEVIVATTVNIEDLEVVKLCSGNKIRVFCGSSDDVMDRFYQLSKLFEPENVVRITADCPMIDPDVIEYIISCHLREDADYTSNTIVESYPDGEDVEVFKFFALKKAWNEAKLSSEREHVTPYIKKNPSLFKLQSIQYKTDLSSKRWTLDNQEDYEFISKIYKALYGINNFFGMDDILKFLADNPEFEKINCHISRNEGYQKSLKDDQVIIS